MKGKLIWSIFWALVGVFVIVVGIIFIGSFIEAEEPPMFYIVLLSAGGVVLIGLGVALLVLTVKAKVRGMLKGFLLLTGASVVGFPIFAILHNVVGGLLNIEEPVFFIMATMVCPIGFVVGAVGTIVLGVKKQTV